MKHAFNGILGAALEQVPPAERVVVDTGDGAAVTFLGDPEGALFVALALLDKVGELPVRLGINLGPVSLMKDINGLDNVVGDGINVAERVMSFATPGQMLVSRSFYEVMSLLAPDYAALFRQEATRSDKHERAHELYALTDAVRVGRRVQEAQARLRTERRSAPRQVEDPGTPAQVFDAGTHFIVSAYSPRKPRGIASQAGARGKPAAFAPKPSGEQVARERRKPVALGASRGPGARLQAPHHRPDAGGGAAESRRICSSAAPCWFRTPSSSTGSGPPSVKRPETPV